jgi:hypothetical protein
MQTNRYVGVPFVLAALLSPPAADAQGGGRGTPVFRLGTAEIINVEMENVPAVAGSPFTADATTEFTQMLSDGNRIERRFSTSLARDGRGRTRSEQDVAMLGPLVVLQKGKNWSGNPDRSAPNEAPRFTVITDPIENVTYTLDVRMKEARRSPSKIATLQLLERKKVAEKIELDVRREGGNTFIAEALGTRQIEGVSAEGTRMTTTIPAGQVGNLNPIHLVTERWFAKELQMAVLITRRDPRSGETVYRLTNIVRAEPPPDLFTVPSDYRIVEMTKKLERSAASIFERELKTLDKARSGAQQ